MESSMPSKPALRMDFILSARLPLLGDMNLHDAKEAGISDDP